MNVFFLDRNPRVAAEYHLDKHVVKMIQEYAQLLSTAHRILDGEMKTAVLQSSVYRNLCTLGWSGQVNYSALLLPGEMISFETTVEGPEQVVTRQWTIRNKKAMDATHVNHPCGIWVRKSADNYKWLYELFLALCEEKTHRYPKGPNDTLTKYGDFLSNPPKNILSKGFTEPPLVMPNVYKKHGDPATSYRNFYIGDKFRFAKWTNRNIPRWFFKDFAEVWSNDPDDRVKYLLDEKQAKKTQITINHVKKYLPDVYNRMVV